jgi:phosphatidylglycerophosphatase A
VSGDDGASRRPVRGWADLGFSDRVAHVLAVWFGCGHLPLAPGTWGTVGAVPLYLLLRPHGRAAIAAAAVVLTGVGVWAAGRVVVNGGSKDPQIVCLDEVAGVLITWLGASATPVGCVAGFVVFRVLDQLKPWPARAAERWPGGWGVMMDDVWAGLWGALLLWAARRLGLPV